MARFVVADWHLGENRFELMNRPFSSQQQMVDYLIKKHNQIVAKDDEVFMLGDVCYKETPEYLKYVADFNGKKILVRGNHDRGITDEEFKNYFEDIIPEGKGIEIKIEDIPCYFTHYPTQGRQGCFNVVGHIHAAWKYQLNMLNCGVDVHHFSPVNLSTIPIHFKAIHEYYDEDIWAAYSPLNSCYVGIRGKKGTYFKNPS